MLGWRMWMNVLTISYSCVGHLVPQVVLVGAQGTPNELVRPLVTFGLST